MSNYLDMVKRYEGFRASPYLCAAHVPTIGYGTTVYPDGRKVSLKDTPITEATATAYLIDYVNKQVLPHIEGLYTTDGQKAALVSLLYNVGAPAFNKSKLCKAIKARDWATAFKEWDFGYKQGLKGLLKRRSEEMHLFFRDL